MATRKADNAAADQLTATSDTHAGERIIPGTNEGSDLAHTSRGTGDVAGVPQGPTLQHGDSDGSVQVLRVITKRDGFRRAGREWNGTTDVLLTDLSPKQVKQLQGEPTLATMLLDVPIEQAYELVGR